MPNDLDTRLQRAAILIDSLDQETADSLLAVMPAADAEQVRRVVAQLGSVDPEIRENVLDEFLQAASLSGQDGVEVDPSLANSIAQAASVEASPIKVRPRDKVVRNTPPGHTEGPAGVSSPSTPPFEFLSAAATPDVADYLQQEHPQTSCLVLAHLAPDRAAAVLRCMPARQQAEIVKRLAALDAMDHDVVRAIEQELKKRFEELAVATAPAAPGWSALSAILDASEDTDRSALLAHLQGAFRLPDEYHAGRAAEALALPMDSPRKLTSAADVPLESDRTPYVVSPRESTPVQLFSDLMRLTDFDLAKLIRHADPEVILLVLAGAPRVFNDRILRRLPSSEARLLRLQIERLGPIRLSDIECAQRRLAELAEQLSEQGAIQWSAKRGFVVAA